MENFNESILALLEKNNQLLEKIVKMQEKEHRAQKWRSVIHIFMTLLPFLIAIGITYYLFTLVNNNIQAVVANIDALKEFMVGLVPDFSGVGDKLNDVWNDVTSWN
jgi:ATP-dependent Zn protease